MTMTQTGRSESEQATIEKFETEMMDGTVFRNHERSAASIIGYQPPARSDSYPRALAVLAKGAKLSDRQAELVGAAVHALSPFGPTAGEAVERMFRAVARRLADPYVDVIRKASPEPGRPSNYTHEWTLADRLTILVTLRFAADCYIPGSGGVGWCAADLLARENVRTLMASEVKA